MNYHNQAIAGTVLRRSVLGLLAALLFLGIARGWDPPLDAMLKQLADPAPGDEQDAIEFLQEGKFERLDFSQYVAPELMAESGPAWREALEYVEQTENPALVEILCAQLRTSPHNKRILETLEEIGHPAALPILHDLLRRDRSAPDPEIAEALSEIYQDADWMPPYRQGLWRYEPDVLYPNQHFLERLSSRLEPALAPQ